MTDPRRPEIGAALAQIEAARLRHEQLVACGRLTRESADGGDLPRETLPGYTLIRELHRGGQGIVYLGVQSSTGRQVAIKLLRLATRAISSPAALARFEREIEVLSRLKHRNVVTIHDCGRTDQFVYLVMDYVAGRPVDEHVERAASPLPRTLELFSRICDGVNAAHLRGIIHRDLKPGNILVDELGEPHVLDFGLAKLTDSSSDAPTVPDMTETGQFIGSLPWASPEQAEGRVDGLDIRTDVYSLGVVLYQILTGRFPYPVSGRLDDVVRHIVHTSPARPSSVDRAVDRELETILLKCLAKEPERRYQNAGELARDIRRYLANEPIEARRDSLAYVMAKQLARFRAAALASSAILIALLVALIVSVAFWREAVEQRSIAQQSAAATARAAEAADREADQARAVNEFMRDVLTSVDPDNQGADVRLTQVLARASATASQRFAAHPHQEAHVREMLGQVYFNLSLWHDAEREQRAVLELRRRCFGDDDPRTLQSESICAGIALNLSRYREVEAALTELLPRMCRILGPDDVETLAARRSLAIAWLYQGRIDEAEEIFLELRGHPALANNESMQMRLAFSLIDVLQWRRARLSAGPQRSASLVQEETLAHEWIDRSTRLNGPQSGMTHQARVILAEIHCDQGNHADAVAECRLLLENTRGRLPECHDVRAMALSILAISLGYMGEVDEPAELYLRRIECVRSHGLPARIALVSSMTDALPYLERAGRAAEGESIARELGEALRGFGHGFADTSAIYVARFMSMQGRHEAADELFQSLLSQDAPRFDAQAGARLHMFYAGHLARRGSFAEAESELHIAAAAVGDPRHGTQASHPDDLIRAYVALYDAWGKPLQADLYRRLGDDIGPVCRADLAVFAARHE